MRPRQVIENHTTFIECLLAYKGSLFWSNFGLGKLKTSTILDSGQQYVPYDMKALSPNTSHPTLSPWRNWKRKLKREARTIRAVGLGTIFKAIWPKSHWERDLPIQLVRQISVPGFAFSSIDDIAAQIGATCSGTHSFYLSPTQWAQSALSPLQQNYPAGCGIKLMKRLGGVHVPYVIEGNSGKIQELVLPSHKHQTLTFNYLYRLGLAPRLFDLLEVNGGNTTCTAYVVEHASGSDPSLQDCTKIIASLKQLVEENRLQLVNWHGFDGRDFQLPDCNQNVFLNAKSLPVYVDVQNFKLLNYDQHLIATIQNPESGSHSCKSVSPCNERQQHPDVPETPLAEMCVLSHHMTHVLPMLKPLEIKLEERLVMSIGWNIGLVGSQYLQYGIRWFHGWWDCPHVVTQARNNLLSIGCTRFTLTETQLDSQTNLHRQLPQFLHHQLQDSILSYRSIHTCTKWLPALTSLPWTYMIYEGDKTEGEKTTHDHLADLQQIIPLEILAESEGTATNIYFPYMAVVKRL